MAEPEPDTSVPFWARPHIIAAIVLAVAAIKLWFAAGTELVYDEAYYTLWSMDLSPGYLDHPPAVAWLIALGRALAGNNEVGVRLPSIVADLLVSAAIYRMGRILFDKRVAALATIWHAVSIAAALGVVITPDAPSILFWTLTLWAVAEFIHADRPHWWLIAGIFAGLGLTAKLTNLFLAPGIFLFLLSSPERRRWFERWQVWAAPVIAGVVFSPVVLWNAGNNWITFWFQGRRTLGTERSPTGFVVNVAEAVVGQALAVGPPLVIFAVAAAVLVFRRKGAGVRTGAALCGLTAVPLLLYFVYHATHSRVELNWLLPIWPGLTLCAAWAALSIQWSGLRGRAVAVLRHAQLAYGIGAIAVVFTQALFYPITALPFDRTRDLHGWRGLQAQVAALAEERGARWVVTDDYGLTSQIGAYGLFAATPLPVHQLTDRLRYVFQPPLEPDALGWPALHVSPVANPAAPVPPEHYFGRSELVSIFPRLRGGEVLHYYQAYLVSEPTAAFIASTGS